MVWAQCNKHVYSANHLVVMPLLGVAKFTSKVYVDNQPAHKNFVYELVINIDHSI